MAEEKMTKQSYDKTSSKRQASHLARLAETGGKPVRVDTSGEDMAKLDDLVAKGYAPSRVEAYRRALRDAHSREIVTNDT
jgi:hypothetical protein